MVRERSLLRELSDIFVAPERYTLHIASRSVDLASDSVSVRRSGESVEFLLEEGDGSTILVTLPMCVEEVERSRLLKYHIDRMELCVMSSYSVEFAKFASASSGNVIYADVVVQRVVRGVRLDEWCNEMRDGESVARIYLAIDLLDRTLRECMMRFVGRRGIAADGVIVGEDGLLYPFRYNNMEVCSADESVETGCASLRRYVEEQLGECEVVDDVSLDEYAWAAGEPYKGHLYSGEIHEERVLVEDISGWGFVDGDNRVVIEPRYLRAFPFDEGRAVVQSKRGWGVIDIYGVEIIPSIYDSVGYSNASGVSSVRKGDKWAYFSYVGEQLTPFDMDYPEEM